MVSLLLCSILLLDNSFSYFRLAVSRVCECGLTHPHGKKHKCFPKSFFI